MQVVIIQSYNQQKWSIFQLFCFNNDDDCLVDDD